MLSIKKLVFFAFCVLCTYSTLHAQKATITPSPDEIDLNAPATIVIDVNACDPNPLQGFAGDVYLWTWVDGASASAPNGSWNSSATGQLMTPVAGQPGKYSYTFTPSVLAYYGVTAADIFGSAKGLGMLAKMKDGTGDMKTEDINIKIPQPVVGKVLTGTFPAKLGDTLYVNQDDIVHFVYQNSLDTLAAFKNIGPDDLAVFMRLFFSDGTPPINYSPPSTYDSNPALALKYVKDGEYRLSFIPKKFFAAAEDTRIAAKLAAGFTITKVSMRVVKKRSVSGTTNPINGPVPYEFIFPKY